MDSIRVYSQRPVNVFIKEWYTSENIEDSRLRSHETRLQEIGLRIEFIQKDITREHYGIRARISDTEDLQETALRRDSLRVFGARPIQPIEFVNLND